MDRLTMDVMDRETCQASLHGFFREEYWSRLPFPTPDIHTHTHTHTHTYTQMYILKVKLFKLGGWYHVIMISLNSLSFPVKRDILKQSSCKNIFNAANKINQE